MSTPIFTIKPVETGTEIRLLAGAGCIAFDRWAYEAPEAAKLIAGIVARDRAVSDSDIVLIYHDAISELSPRQAASLRLPETTRLRARIEGHGIFVRPDFRLVVKWVRSSGQHVLGVERCGAWLKEPTGWRRLPASLFAIAEAVDRHAAATDEAARLAAVASLRRVLPEAMLTGSAAASGIVGNATILEADAMSLTTTGDGDAIQVVPVLHKAGDEQKQSLLEELQQKEFGTRIFLGRQTVQSVYALGNATYVAIAPPLKAALTIVRQVASQSPEKRREFFREPRPAIRAALDDDADAALLESLVVETKEWSDRVVGLGLWTPRVLPWIALAPNDWFGEAAEPILRGLMVGNRTLPLDAAQAASLADRMRGAMDRGDASVMEPTDDGLLEVPVSLKTIEVLDTLARSKAKLTSSAEAPFDQASRATVLIIKSNENERDVEAVIRRRGELAIEPPKCLKTALKLHQQEGLRWLQESWIAGSPGVLLADDMGLGKTLQGLAFLAWLREGMENDHIARQPLLIVAPTGLLTNWLEETEKHLAYPRLGVVVDAFGKGLARLRVTNGNMSGRLNTIALKEADWILTTYETLRDYITDFGSIGFAAMLIDEAQRVKTPAIRMTDAIKAVNADFRIAMTGTPVENRLADLWCIVDGVAPGYLGDLAGFSKTFELEPDPERLAKLKDSLDKPVGDRPPLLLRRLKEDRLPDLPPQKEVAYSDAMSGDQLTAYEDGLALGRDISGPDGVLRALQRLRAVSLHPGPDDLIDDAEWAARSARVKRSLIILDGIAARGERALIFLDDLDLMARLSGLLQRRYKLPGAPLIINGNVSGQARQERVNSFQKAPDGFDAMLISPRAGGVGLTITRANHVIHLSRWWNPAVEDQCTARARRIGQTRTVTVHLPMATLPGARKSFDENLHALLERKRQLMRETLLPPKVSDSELGSMLEASLK